MIKRAIPLLAMTACVSFGNDLSYPVVDTGQVQCYDDRIAIGYPEPGSPYYGQDAQYLGNAPDYQANDDGTVTDRVTGLMWTQDPGEKKAYVDPIEDARKCRVGGYTDWRLPDIKELYSLIQFNGTDPDPRRGDPAGLVPFIDSSVFRFHYGNEDQGERIIDSQFASSTLYVSTTMGGDRTVFGVNFADGRIKGYPADGPGGRRTRGFYVLYVRGNPEYGINQFRDNGDATVTDEATGLTWMKADSGVPMDWPTALVYAEDLELAGHDDWRLPNAKELQSIVDYSRSPDTTGSAAIDPVFDATEIINEGGELDYAHYWTASSHVRNGGSDAAVYFAFGRSLGWMPDHRSPSGAAELMDVHGAGSQRSDPKVGDASQFPSGRGPQGDVIRIDNMVRCVRGGDVRIVESGPEVIETTVTPNLPALRGRQPAGGFMLDHDRNGDGKVTRDEFQGPPDHFDRFDRNFDGSITRDEAPVGPPPRNHGAQGLS